MRHLDLEGIPDTDVDHKTPKLTLTTYELCRALLKEVRNALLEIRAFQAFPHFVIGVLHRGCEIDEQGTPQLALHDAG